jgi:hypothetical protein
MNGQSIRTFLSANTPGGFVSLYEPFIKNKITYIIKGGPGSGKSSLMKKVASEAFSRKMFTEYIYCSSDPDSLDGVSIPDLNTILADGTPPHVLEPPVPGAAGGIVNLSCCWDEKKLRFARTDIEQLKEEISKCFSQCYKYLAAAGSVSADISDCVSQWLLNDKIEKYTGNFIKKHFYKNPDKNKGDTYKRFLSGVTPKGYITFKDTIYTLCDYVYVFTDRYQISSYILNIFADAAIKNGHDVYIFNDPIRPGEPEHLAIPSLNIAFVTSNKLHCFEPSKTHRINLKRFLNEDVDLSSNRLNFARRIQRMCIDKAIDAVKKAKALHDDLEEYYIDSMNFKEVNTITQNLTNFIFNA